MLIEDCGPLRAAGSNALIGLIKPPAMPVVVTFSIKMVTKRPYLSHYLKMPKVY